MAQLRKEQPAFKGDADVALLRNAHPQVLALQRNRDLIGLFNFSNQSIDLKFSELGLASFDVSFPGAAQLRLQPNKFVWVNIAGNASPHVLVD